MRNYLAASCFISAFSLLLLTSSTLAQETKDQKGKKTEGPPPEPYPIERWTRGLLPYQVGPLSPDGKQLLILTKKNRDNAALLVLDATSHAVRSLVELSGGVAQPCWSPSGDSIAMTGSDGRPFPGIYLLTLANLSLQRMTSANTAEREPAFLQSGDRIIFISEAPKVEGAAFGEKHPLVLRLGQTETARLTDEDLIAIHPVPIPKSDKLLLVLIAPDTGRHRLVEVSVKGAILRDLSGDQISYVQSVVAHRGGSLAVLEAQHRPQSPMSVYVIHLQSGEITELGGEAERTFSPALSPDGKRVLYSEQANGQIHLYLQALDSDEREQITQRGRASWGSVWLDGDRAVFESDRDGEADLYVVRFTKPSPPPARSTS